MAQTLFDGFTGLVRDRAGNIVTGAQVEVLNAVDPDPFSASNTLATVFSDRAGTSQVDQVLNPILSDAQGKFTFYADAGYYHVIAYNAGENYAIPDVAIGTAKSLDIEDARGGAMPNEVRMFVGSVPAGWEKIQTQPLNLSEALYTYLKQDQFGLGSPVNEPGRSLGYIQGLGLLGMSGAYSQAVENFRIYRKSLASINGLGPEPSTVFSEGRFNQARPVCAISGDSQYLYMFGSAIDVDGSNMYATRVSLSDGSITFLSDCPASIDTSPTTSQLFSRGCAREEGTERYYVQTSFFEMHRYDATLNSWTALSGRPDFAMGSFMLSLPDGRILTAGGSASGLPTSACYIYDPSLDSWSPAAPLPSANLPFTMNLHSGGYNQHQVIPVKLQSGDVAFGFGGASHDSGIFVFNVSLEDWSFYKIDQVDPYAQMNPNNIYSVDGLTINSYDLRSTSNSESTVPSLMSQHRLAVDPSGLAQRLVYYARYVGE